MNPEHRLYHPKWYRVRVPVFWWLSKQSYLKFIGRELTSVFVAYSAVLLIVLALALDRGEGAYLEVMDWLSRPAVIGVHVLVLLAVLFHTVTWLNLAPMAIVAKIGGRRVPASVVLLGHYAAWIVCTGFVAWVLIWR